MKKYNKFTLVELLTVIGIIAILAGLVLGAVTLSQSSARKTQAKADMASIILALRGVENTYGKIVKTTGSGSTSAATFDTYSAVILNTDATGPVVCLGQPEKADHSKDDTDSEKAYDALIAELSVPKNGGISSININKRKIVFLEPKVDFNALEDYTLKTAKTDNDSDATSDPDEDKMKKKEIKLNNKRCLWRDPWGHRYTVFINVSGTKHIKIPEVEDEPKAVSNNSNSHNIATDIAIYSHGPNGIDNGGCNADLDTCTNLEDQNNHKNHDDIASWHK